LGSLRRRRRAIRDRPRTLTGTWLVTVGPTAKQVIDELVVKVIGAE
jgi:hypothetical protein